MLTMMAQVADLTEGDAPTSLNIWPMWEVDDRAVRILLVQTSARLKLVVSALVEDDTEALDRHTQDLDRTRPMLALLHALWTQAGALPPYEDDPAMVLAELAHAPTHDSWLGREHDDVALLCRMLMEAESARRRDDERLSTVYTHWCADAAAALLQDV